MKDVHFSPDYFMCCIQIILGSTIMSFLSAIKTPHPWALWSYREEGVDGDAGVKFGFH